MNKLIKQALERLWPKTTKVYSCFGSQRLLGAKERTRYGCHNCHLQQNC